MWFVTFYLPDIGLHEKRFQEANHRFFLHFSFNNRHVTKCNLTVIVIFFHNSCGLDQTICKYNGKDKKWKSIIT